jgi:transcriptional regulator with XRE-family HTH domain
VIGVLDNQKFRAALNRKGIKSTLELSRLSGIHRNTLAPYLNGEKSIYSNTILELAQFLEIDPELLKVEDSSRAEIFIYDLAERFLKDFSSKYSELAVILFGSRVSGKAKKFSDYDLGVVGGNKLISSLDFLAMKEFISAHSDDFAWKVDLVNLDEAPTWFLSEMGEKPTRLLAGNIESYYFFKGRAYECGKTREARSSAA